VVSGRLDVVSGRLDVVSGRLDVVSGRLDVVSGRLDVPSGRLDVPSVQVDAPSRYRRAPLNRASRFDGIARALGCGRHRRRCEVGGVDVRVRGRPLAASGQSLDAEP
jgi:hypothetical protein